MKNICPSDRFIRVEEYLESQKIKFYETTFLDDEIFNLSIEFYNEYFGYKENPINRDVAFAYASMGVRLNADLYKSMMPMDEKKLDYFYEITPLYFFHDILRMMDGIHREQMEEMLEMAESPFLDFAGGTGAFSIFFAKKGFDVSYCDSNNMQRAWVKWVSDKLGLGIKVYSSLDEITDKFMFVQAKDVAEHVLDPIALKERLTSIIKNGGKFNLSQVPCIGPDEMAPMHFKVDGEPDNIKFDKQLNYETLTRNPR